MQILLLLIHYLRLLKFPQLLGEVSRPIHTLNFGIQYLPAKINLVKIKQKIILSRIVYTSHFYQIDKIVHAFANLVRKTSRLIVNISL